MGYDNSQTDFSYVFTDNLSDFEQDEYVVIYKYNKKCWFSISELIK